MPISARADMIATFRRLALQAGNVIMSVYDRQDVEVRVKGDSSPVTEADDAADAVISAGLNRTYPSLPLVTEEQADTHDLDAQTFLIVDPLDGTKEFIHRRGDFTVNIALVENGVPTIGVVYAPAKRRLFYTSAQGGAVEETGAHDPDHIGELAALKVAKPDNAALRVVASKSHRTHELETYIGRYSVSDSVAAGSSLKFCLVATGEADFYPRLGPTMEWDTAAGHAVLAGAGGAVLAFDSHEPLLYGKPGFRNGHFLAVTPGVTLKSG